MSNARLNRFMSCKNTLWALFHATHLIYLYSAITIIVIMSARAPARVCECGLMIESL